MSVKVILDCDEATGKITIEPLDPLGMRIPTLEDRTKLATKLMYEYGGEYVDKEGCIVTRFSGGAR